MNKWDYIRLIGDADNHAGQYLLDLMNRYDAPSTYAITLEQAKEYWFELKERLAL